MVSREAHRCRYVCVGIVALLLVGRTAATQTGQLSGLVRDQSRAVVPGASVVLEHEGTGARRETQTDGGGFYAFPSMAAGTYRLIVHAAGFQRVTRPGVVLRVSEDARLDIRLDVAAVADTVEVQGTALAGTRDGSVGTVIDRRSIENIPLSGRTFHSLLELAPGVVPVTDGFAVNGQRGDANNFTVDGASVNLGTGNWIRMTDLAGGTRPATTLGGGFNGMAPLDALQEFRIQTSTFAPEFGRTPGGQVSIVTKSGTNRRTGSLFEQFRDDSLAANDWFANSRGQEKPEFAQHNFGGSLGGPIQRNRLFYFATYEGLRLREPRTLIASVPNLDLRARAPAAIRPYLNAFPRPTGPDVAPGLGEYAESYAAPTRFDVWSGKVTTQVSPRTQVSARVSRAPSTRETLGASALSTSRQRLSTISANVTHTLTARAVLDGHVNLSRNVTRSTIDMRPDLAERVPAAALPPGIDFSRDKLLWGVGQESVAIGPFNDHRMPQVQATGSLTATLGRHQVKLGFDVRRLRPHTAAEERYIVIKWDDIEALLQQQATYVSVSRMRTIDGTQWNGSLFAQDTWRVNARLSLTYGFRWDVSPAPSFEAGSEPLAVTQLTDLETLEFQAPGTRLWRTRWGNIAPRAGFAYNLDESARTVLTGGAGLFYDVGTQAAGQAFSLGYPHYASRTSGLTFFDPAALDLDIVLPSTPTFPLPDAVSLVDPHLATPRTLQWNVRVERQVGQAQSASIGYVGARGDDLLSNAFLNRPNSRFRSLLFLGGNEGRSSYHALQAQYQRRLVRGVQGLVSYTLGRAYDDASGNTTPRAPASRGYQDWGPAEHDVRHSLSGSASWNVPGPARGVARALFEGWSIDTLARWRSGVPFNIVTGYDSLLLGYRIDRPDVVPGVPWWIDDPAAPGGRRVNPAAFVRAPLGQQGDLPRNALRGLSAFQVDLGLRRSFPVAGARVQVRVDAFNVFNVVNFGTVVGNMRSPSFGQVVNLLNHSIGGSWFGGLSSFHQWGGPRQIEFGVRVQF